MIKIVVDCFGGDRSPDANIDGALLALTKLPDLAVVLTGDEKILKEKLAGKAYDEARLSIVHAPEVIGVEEKPTDAIRLKKDSSMVKAVRMLREDPEIAGIVSTGSTGALVAASMTRIGRIQNVIRPAFCPIVPSMTGGVVAVCDSGANVDVTPAHLQQFAIMASEYLKYLFDVKEPRVALLNIGVEEDKGDELRKNTFKLLQETPQVNFVGNMEARELLSGDYDVVVCDGFAGNVLIKSTEGAFLEMLKMLKRDIYSKTLYKVGALFMKGMFAKEKAFLDYQNYGGSVLLGLEKVVVKGHGSSNATAVWKCIEQAYNMQLADLSGKIAEKLPVYDKTK